jgi:hypothetical protein
VLDFLISGQMMSHHTPPLSAFGADAQLMYRSRHIYILASGLVNLMLGLYLHFRTARWRMILQSVGSTFLVAAPVLLGWAFMIEPERGFREGMWRSSYGLYALFLGCMSHLVSSAGKSDVKSG